MNDKPRSRFDRTSLAVGNLSICAAALFAVGLGPVATPPVDAGERDFPFTYDWKQLDRGEREVEVHSTYLKSNNSFEEEVEFEKALSDRLAIAPYVVFARDSGRRLKYAGLQLEARYQLQGFRPNTVLSSVYAEYSHPKDERDGLETRIILSRFGTDRSDLSFNFVHVNRIWGGVETTNTVSLGYARALDKAEYGPRAGAELIHDISNSRLNVGPTFAFSPAKQAWIVAGYAFPITGHDNGAQIRLNVEHEF